MLSRIIARCELALAHRNHAFIQPPLQRHLTGTVAAKPECFDRDSTFPPWELEQTPIPEIDERNFALLIGTLVNHGYGFRKWNATDD